VDIEKDLADVKEKNEYLEENNLVLEKRCETLYQNLLAEKAKNKETEKLLEEANEDIDWLEEKNLHLYKYLEKLKEEENFVCSGQKVSELKERQKRRRLRELKTSVEKALWFADSFGLNLQSVHFKDQNGEQCKLDYQAVGKPKSYKELSEDDQDKIKSVLFLADKFCISNAAYHELTMTAGGDGFPRSYLIKQCQDQLDQLCHVTRTPGTADGAQLS